MGCGMGWTNGERRCTLPIESNAAPCNKTVFGFVFTRQAKLEMDNKSDVRLLLDEMNCPCEH